MASSPSPPRTTKRQKKSDHHQPVKLLSLHNSKICFDGKKIASNDAERQKIAEFESALKKMNVSDMSLQEQTALIKNYNLCYQRLNNNTEPDLEQILGIVSDWAPKTDLICLYVRWAKKLRSNFHLDSIATLLTVAKQCDYSALEFLNITALKVSPRTARFSRGRYGVSFGFVTSKKEEENFTHQFTGFMVTLDLLESSIVGSRAVNGKVGMRQSTARTPSPMLLRTGDGTKKTAVLAVPTTEFHKKSSLTLRVWSDIHHRWVALRVIQHLVSLTSVQMEDQAALEYSFQMNADAGCVRFDWLDSIVGVCLRFPSPISIASNKAVLAKVLQDARLFYSHGTTYLRNTSPKQMYDEMVVTFGQLQKCTRPVTFSPRSQYAWLVIRGYAFNLWLEATKNTKLKLKLTQTFSRTSDPNKKKMNSEQSSVVTTNGSLPLVGNKRQNCAHDNLPLSNLLTTKEVDQLVSRRVAASDSTKTSGLASLLGSRKDLPVHISTSPADHDVGRIEEIDKQSSVSTISHRSFSKETLLQDFDWTSFRLVTHDELAQSVASYLIIRTKDNGDLLSKLSPMEVYSADNLGLHQHCRVSGPSDTDPTKHTMASKYTLIGPSSSCVTDPTGLYHVAREGSSYFQEHGSLLLSPKSLSDLCQAVVKYGKVDGSRSSGQFRINIGCGGQHRPNGVPAKLVGLDFAKSLESDDTFNCDLMLRSIGSLTEFVWKTMVGLQRDAKGSPIAPDRNRHELYARFLCEKLFTDSSVGFEDVTLVVSILFPRFDGVNEHVDRMNDSLMGYTRTGTLNICLKLNEEIIIHFQLIANFRKVIRQYTIPFYYGLQSTKNHIDNYLRKWQADINNKFAGLTEQAATPFDRSPFFLDDRLHFERLDIGSGICGDYLLTVINPSRVLSFSMFIDPLVELKKDLCFDQRLELGFVCSLLNNPFRFHETITRLTVKHRADEDGFRFGIHPFYDWASLSMELFGSWQGGIHNRWSPCGGEVDMLMTFGAQPNASTDERMVGESKLSIIVELLYRHLCWVDTLQGRGDNPTDDLPLDTITQQLDLVCSQVNDIASCQLGPFRLSMFTTVHTGCGDLKPGKHLRQLMFPVKGCASYKHLACPSGDRMSIDRAANLGSSEPGTTVVNDGDDGIITEYHDRAMRLLSSALGREQYFRDEMECLLCESMHSRNLVNCCDWFCRGQSIYDIDKSGYTVVRPFGAETKWKVMEYCPIDKFAFLVPTITYVRHDDTLMCIATMLASELRNCKKLVFNGRITTTSNSVEHYTNEYATEVKLMPHQHRSANFYCGFQAQLTKRKNMHVLGSGEYQKNLDVCNDFCDYYGGRALFTWLPLKLSSPLSSQMLGASYHMGSDESSEQITYYPGHLDKAFVCSAWFIPLGVTFFTMVAFPTVWHHLQDEPSLASYNKWICTLEKKDRDKLATFEKAFEDDAQIQMKNVELKIYVYENRIGSLLAFPTNLCYHTTVTPRSSVPRDLIIVHPLV